MRLLDLSALPVIVLELKCSQIVFHKLTITFLVEFIRKQIEVNFWQPRCRICSNVRINFRNAIFVLFLLREKFVEVERDSMATFYSLCSSVLENLIAYSAFVRK